MKKLILSIAVAGLSFNALAGTVEVKDAPFPFEPLVMHEFPQKDFPITRYGARNGDVAANTKAFEKAMEACSKAGGGRVVVPAGDWISGPIRFKSGCKLFLSEGSRVVFDDDMSLYLPAVHTTYAGLECFNYSPMVYAYECENIAIDGLGTLETKIDSWSKWFMWKVKPESFSKAWGRLLAMAATDTPVEYRHMELEGCMMRPRMIQFFRCRNVQLSDFHIYQSPSWCIHFWMSDDVYVHGLDVFAHGHNSDGLDLEMTQHVLVENCRFDQADDVIVLKAGCDHDGWRLNKPTQDIVVRNCEIVHGNCILGVGSEMSAGVRRVYLHDCISSDSVYRMFYAKTNERRGGFIEDIHVRNVKAPKAYSVFEIDTDVLYAARKISPTYVYAPSRIRNITLENAACDEADKVYILIGNKDMPIEDIRLKDIKVGMLNHGVSYVTNVKNLDVDGIRWDETDTTGTRTVFPNYNPGR